MAKKADNDSDSLKKEVTQLRNRAAAAEVTAYALSYGSNRGLSPAFPRLVVGMMRELSGWPVRNADGGANIAYFDTTDAAEAAIVGARRTFRARFGRDYA